MDAWSARVPSRAGLVRATTPDASIGEVRAVTRGRQENLSKKTHARPLRPSVRSALI
jgi:hypothetical protein